MFLYTMKLYFCKCPEFGVDKAIHFHVYLPACWAHNPFQTNCNASYCAHWRWSANGSDLWSHHSATVEQVNQKMQTVQRFHSMTYDAAPCSYPPFLVDDDPFVLGADQTGERRSCKYSNNSLTRSYRYQSYNLYWLIFKVRVQIQTGVSATVDDWLTGGSAHSFAEWPIPDRRSSFNPWLRLVECEPAVWKVLRSDPLNCCDLRSVAIVYRFVNFYS